MFDVYKLCLKQQPEFKKKKCYEDSDNDDDLLTGEQSEQSENKT